MAKRKKEIKIKQEVERQEKNKSLTRRIVGLFQEGKEKGFTATPHRISKCLDSNYFLTEFIMKKLEGDDVNILYSFRDEHKVYSSNPPHLWKKTTEEAEELIKRYLRDMCQLLSIKYDEAEGIRPPQ